MHPSSLPLAGAVRSQHISLVIDVTPPPAPPHCLLYVLIDAHNLLRGFEHKCLRINSLKVRKFGLEQGVGAASGVMRETH